jgi:glycosyltransferase involved in cell wall biosynthesis
MNNQNHVLLSVTVPTYNRSSYLKDFLISVINPITKYNLYEQVEIIISDNCSPDDTESVVENLKNDYPNIRIIYNKNIKNLGVIPNIAKLIELANGKYLMIYGDDDLMCEDALPQLLDILRNNENTKVFLLKPKEVKNYDYHEETIALQIAVEKYFYTLGNFGLFVSDTFSMKQILAKNYTQIITTCWPQTELMFLAMIESKQEKPLFVSNLDMSIYPNHMNNTVYTGYYIYETTFFALYRVAKHIEDYLGKPFVELAMSNTHFLLPKTKDFWKNEMYYYTTYRDYPNEIADLQKTVLESLVYIKHQKPLEITKHIQWLLKTPKLQKQYWFAYKNVKCNIKQKFMITTEGILAFLAILKDFFLPYSILQDIHRQEASENKFLEIKKAKYEAKKRSYGKNDFT